MEWGNVFFSLFYQNAFDGLTHDVDIPMTILTMLGTHIGDRYGEALELEIGIVKRSLSYGLSTHLPTLTKSRRVINDNDMSKLLCLMRHIIL
jgi:hypothetical protein